MKAIQKLDTIFDRTILGLAILAAALVAFMMVSVTLNVIMRYFFSRPLLWVHEIAEISLLYMTFLATAWVLKNEGHVGMDLLIEWLSPKYQLFLNIVTSFISAIVCLVITWYGVPVVWAYYVKGTYQLSLLELPTALFLAVVPVGCFLLFIQFLRRTGGFVQRFRALGREHGMEEKVEIS